MLNRYHPQPRNDRLVVQRKDALCNSDLPESKPLVAAIAHELWKLHGGNEVVNWLEAEMLLERALEDTQAEVRAAYPGSTAYSV